METVVVTLKHAKAKKLLENLAELDLIALSSESPLLRKRNQPMDKGVSAGIKKPMSEEEINQQLEELRNEWERNI